VEQVYIVSKLVIKTIHSHEPVHIYKKLLDTFYSTRRKPGLGHFFNNSKGKIGKQSIQNRLTLMDEITDDWMTQLRTDNSLRIMLKKTFIKFDFD